MIQYNCTNLRAVVYRIKSMFSKCKSVHVDHIDETLSEIHLTLNRRKNSLLSCDGIQDGDDCIIWSDCDSTIWADAVDDSIDDSSDILVAEALNETKNKTTVNSSQV